MTQGKHTPGPWEACNPGDYSDYDGKCRVIIGDDLRIVVVLGDHDESAANARLIAAAPDMLESLQEFIKGDNWRLGQKFDPNSGNFDLSKVRVAIARATGCTQ